MNIRRRAFLKGILATGGAMALGTTLLPQSVMAEWPTSAFDAETTEDALKALFENGASAEESDKVIIKAEDKAENGAVVPVEITANLPKVESITIFSEGNPIPLIGQFTFGENADAWVKTRIKMAESSNVVAIVKADGKLYKASKAIEVTSGGCAG
ncbi:thiosulfate oxidation carrier protein SoxY [Candidatus Parabeggiatoa sp. HSG14]|uniref:thiosulfate oxidation carrier protein SoxY n=1 Tax=Candidatus Parabeggiatoa sp. HSG14 TaxID=3055593 RepID=UPI0025A8573B|nr:thiosulfate oxidation carrier protein SoxY [Thiotrichales bacterium HSG14]